MLRSLAARPAAAVLAAVMLTTVVVTAGAGIASAEPALTPDRTASANGRVSAIARVGGTIYLGGSFTELIRKDGTRVSRPYLAAIDAASGDPTAWNPKANAAVRALAVSADGGRIFVGGDFKTLGGRSRTRLGAVEAGSGAVTSWKPTASSTVRALAVKGDRVYAGGVFSTVSGLSRPRLAALDASTGAVITAFNPKPDAGVRAIAPAPGSSGRIYVAGSFSTIGGASRQYLAAVNSADGRASSWRPQPGWIALTLTVSADGGRIFVGGDSSGGHVAAYSATGTLAWHVVLDGDVNALTLGSGGDVLYAGGHFHRSGAIAREKIAAYRASTGDLLPWNPGADSVYGVYAVLAGGGRLAVGGDFTVIGGAGQARYAQFSGSV